MNPRLELYRSGASLTVRHVSARRGGRVAVLDPYRRSREAVVALLMGGHSPRATARALGLPLAVVCALGIRALEAKKLWTKSNSALAVRGNNP